MGTEELDLKRKIKRITWFFIRDGSHLYYLTNR